MRKYRHVAQVLQNIKRETCVLKNAIKRDKNNYYNNMYYIIFDRIYPILFEIQVNKFFQAFLL